MNRHPLIRPAGTLSPCPSAWRRRRLASARAAFDMDAVLRLSSDLSRRLTARAGHRTIDILHVATAVHLGARKFLSFDARQQSLARAAGLEPAGH